MKKHFIVILTFALAAFSFAATKKKFFAYRSFWPETNAMKQFGEIGVDTYAVMPSNTYNTLGEPYCKFPPFWVWRETYVWGNVDNQFDLVLDANPKAKFICMIDINSPIWLTRILDKKNAFGGDSFSHISNALCIEEWRELAKKMVREYVKHMETKYGNKVVSYMIAGGGTSEWYCLSQGFANKSKEAQWHKWLAKKGLPDWEIPAKQQLDSPTIEDKYFDPATQKSVIEYSRFTENTISDGVEDFAKLVREIVGDKKQIGAFCGFIPIHLYGKLDDSQIYASKNIDFVGSPGGYFNRAIGLGGGIASPRKSIDIHGKHWFQEIDHRTHTYNTIVSPYVKIGGVHKDGGAKNQTETNAMLKREFSLAAIMGNSLWCFDMWGQIFNTPETMELVKKSREIWQKYKDANLEYRAEIAMVFDPDSAYYIKNPMPITSTIRALYSCGAPFDSIMFDDIAKLDMSKYKMIVFPHSLSITPEKKKILDKYVFNGGRTVVAIDAFGLSDGKKIDATFVKNLTGFDYKTNGINSKQMNGYKSIYCHENSTMDKKAAMQIAKEAGVHLYTEEALPVYANGKLVAVHTKIGGLKKIHLPHKVKIVKELFSGKIVAENSDNFEYNFISPDTALFELTF